MHRVQNRYGRTRAPSFDLKIKKALIPAAGLGTRLLPATKVVPKELLPIVHRPALEYIADELLDSGIEEVVLVLHPDKESISGHFTKDTKVEKTLEARGQSDRLETLHRILTGMKFTVAYQEEPLGLGHAVWCGKQAIGNEPFAVVLPDDLVRSSTPCLKQMLVAYEKNPASYVAVEEVPQEKIHLYGVVKGTFQGPCTPFQVTSVIEKPPVELAPSRYAIIGRYILDPSVFGALEKISRGSLGELQLTDALLTLALTQKLYAYPFEGTRLDVGQPLGFVQANLVYALDHPKLAEQLKPILEKLLQNL